jgi:acyl carrier protein
MEWTEEQITTKLLVFVKGQLAEEAVQPTKEVPFSEIGLDSHSLLEIVIFLENECNIYLPDSDLTAANLHSIASLSTCAWRNHLASGK